MRRRDELAVVATLLKERLRMGLLKITTADLRRGDVRCDPEHGDARAVTIKQTVDEVQIARSTAACADGKLAGQMSLGPGGKRGNLLVPDMKPLDFAVPADCVRQTVQAVADDAVDAFHSCGGECLDELVSYKPCHRYSPA